MCPFKFSTFIIVFQVKFNQIILKYKTGMSNAQKYYSYHFLIGKF